MAFSLSERENGLYEKICMLSIAAVAYLVCYGDGIGAFGSTLHYAVAIKHCNEGDDNLAY